MSQATFDPQAVDQLARAIPGQSLTDAPGQWPFERPPMVLVTRHRGNSINNFDPLRITLRDFTINRADGTDGSEKYSWIAIGI